MNVRNLPELHRRTAEALGPRVALRHKRFGCYRDVTWSEYSEQVEACAAALIDTGIQPGERVGLLAENRVEWLIADLAILAAGAITVPLHAPLTAPQVHYQLADAGAVWLFVSTSAQLAKVRAILDGADPESMLPVDLKTGNFYRCILNPEDPEPVVIDRWAYRTATGDYAHSPVGPKSFGLSNKNRYASLAQAFGLAADNVNDIRQRVQARCWVIEKDREGS